MKKIKAPIYVNCPHCGQDHVWDAGNRFRPFCSERCKLIDLGRWANEEYRVAKTDSEGLDTEVPNHQA